MFELTSEWPQLIADISPVIVAIGLAWAIYRTGQGSEGR
jgi:hypothetical protein